MTGQPSFTTAQRTMLVLVIGLLLSLGVAIPAAQAQLNMQISIEEVTFDQGAIVVEGIVTCSEATDFTDISVHVAQPTGQKKSQVGDAGDSPGPCPGPQGIPFSVLVAPGGGRFKPGTVFVSASTFACNCCFCDGDSDNLVTTVSK
jgi:hypothetical protein